MQQLPFCRETRMSGSSETRSPAAPPNASNPAAIEVLRVWAVSGEAQQLVLKTTWQDTGAWGLLLADAARHAAKAYANERANEAQTLARIRQFLEAGFATPTSEATQLIDVASARQDSIGA
jgi:hypothetical protein